MDEEPIKLTRAVCYSIGPDGRVSASLLVPWDGAPRFNSFPRDVRFAVQARHYFMATVEESRKLAAARAVSNDLHEAVLDDLLCSRAAELMARRARDMREVDREHLLIYGDWLQPDWLKTLRQAFRPVPRDRSR
jgi:hypothetical protein